MKRRRFLSITAGLALATVSPIQAATLREWRGVALGAPARIALAHPDADLLIPVALSEIARLEAIFSLYRTNSELARLNATGRLQGPSLDLVACLGLCDGVHRATDGRFDPTVQPLWAIYAEAAAAGGEPSPLRIREANARTGWEGLRFDATEIRMTPGMALTLNGIAQGFIADRVAALLRSRGVENVLINTGEIVAIGYQPNGRPWRIGIRDSAELDLRDRALATSAPLGTVLDASGRIGHILDPRSGATAPSVWRQVSISAASAAVADGLSTAACLMPDAGTIRDACHAMRDARLESAIPV